MKLFLLVVFTLALASTGCADATGSGGAPLAGAITCPDGTTTCGDGQYCFEVFQFAAGDGGPSDAAVASWTCRAPEGGCTVASESISGQPPATDSCVYTFCTYHQARVTLDGRAISCMWW